MNTNNQKQQKKVDKVEEQVDQNLPQTQESEQLVNDHSAEAYMKIWEDDQYVAEIQSKKPFGIDREFAKFMTKVQAGLEE